MIEDRVRAVILGNTSYLASFELFLMLCKVNSTEALSPQQF